MRNIMAETKFNETVASLFKGMDAFVSAKTVVGECLFSVEIQLYFHL